MRRLRPLLLLPLLALLPGCEAVVLSPAGDIAAQQRDLLVWSVVLMLIIIVPVVALIIFFAIQYRASNDEARYEPDWDHSTHLELVIWAAPLLIIICLGAITWSGTHLLDPYRPLDRIAKGQSVSAEVEPLHVNVVALDWKWLFIYPEYGIATVNELAAPVDRPIRFHITSSGVMNSFYIPALAGQIYAMPGMETKLHAVINRPGEYVGFSANYSGDGFSNMRFAFHGLDDAGFDRWVQTVRTSTGNLNREHYLELEKPSEKVPVIHYGAVEAGLFDAVINMCVEPGKMCMGEMMQIDRDGGLGLTAVNTTMPLLYDKNARRGGAVFGSGESYVLAICTPTEAEAAAVDADRRRQEQSLQMAQTTPLHRLTGAGLSLGRATPDATVSSFALTQLTSAPSGADVASASQS